MTLQHPVLGLNPPEFLRLASHPLRWRLLGELARSDRTAHELAVLVGEAQNLVSFHLGKLRDAGLVSARRSSADGSDAYFTVDLLPAGTVTFVFTDIEGSTHLLQHLGDAYADVLEVHNELIAVAITGAGGVMFGSRGDALFAAFVDPMGAVAGALEAQRALRSHPWVGPEVRVRMGIHTGEAVIRGGTYIGLEVHRVARICSAARGGQILVSAATASETACALPDGAGLVDLGVRRLKDLLQPDQLFELSHPDLVAESAR